MTLIKKISYTQEDDDEERFLDIPDPDESNNTCELPEQANSDDKEGNNEQKNVPLCDTPSPAVGEPVLKAPKYNPSHRSPLYCGAEHSCVWELTQLAVHYHPSVDHFALLLLKVCIYLKC